MASRIQSQSLHKPVPVHCGPVGGGAWFLLCVLFYVYGFVRMLLYTVIFHTCTHELREAAVGAAVRLHQRVHLEVSLKLTLQQQKEHIYCNVETSNLGWNKRKAGVYCSIILLVCKHRCKQICQLQFSNFFRLYTSKSDLFPNCKQQISLALFPRIASSVGFSPRCDVTSVGFSPRCDVTSVDKC